MPAHFQDCEEYLSNAVNELFGDPRIQAVGIARNGDGYGFKAVKNTARIVPSSASSDLKRTPKQLKKIPVVIEDVSEDILAHPAVSHPLAASFIPEQQPHRPLVCGLQIQNVDDDTRQRTAGALGADRIVIGTLGGFVTLANGSLAVLSNNHVLAGENRGLKNKDRILQPGSLTFSNAQHIATLMDFVQLKPSPANARPALGNVVFNAVDAAVAGVKAGVQHQQAYLPARNLPRPQGTAVAQVGDHVFKVGRTTGLTRGTITSVSNVVGPIAYAPGNCWFSQQIEIKGNNGTMFSDHGDSGSLILRDSGAVVGLLYAGNGTHTYACPIAAVLSALGCILA
jgi:hypothetical protein